MVRSVSVTCLLGVLLVTLASALEANEHRVLGELVGIAPGSGSGDVTCTFRMVFPGEGDLCQDCRIDVFLPAPPSGIVLVEGWHYIIELISSGRPGCPPPTGSTATYCAGSIDRAYLPPLAQ
jgi:hypothetical protein